MALAKFSVTAATLRLLRTWSGLPGDRRRPHGGSCVHSPGIYFNPDGTVTKTIPEKPLAPGSDAALAVEAKHKAQVGGLKHTDTIRGTDGSRTDP